MYFMLPCDIIYTKNEMYTIDIRNRGYIMFKSEKAREARREYARRYRNSEAGRQRIREAQERYWERKFAEYQEEREAQQDAGK